MPKKPRNHQSKQKVPNKGRRQFIKQSSLLTALAAMPPYLMKAAADKWDEQAAGFVKKAPVSVEINGVNRQLTVEPRVTLLDLLREQMGLPGTKKGCDHGQCG